MRKLENQAKLKDKHEISHQLSHRYRLNHMKWDFWKAVYPHTQM